MVSLIRVFYFYYCCEGRLIKFALGNANLRSDIRTYRNWAGGGAGMNGK